MELDPKLVQKLLNMRHRSAEARALFDALRGSKVTTTTVEALVELAHLTPRQVRTVLSVLEKFGMGRLVLGRKGNPTRFDWHLSPRSLPDRQPGEPEPMDQFAPLGGEVLRSKTATVWVVQLAAKTYAQVVLPPKPSVADLETLRDYCDAHIEALSASKGR